MRRTKEWWRKMTKTERNWFIKYQSVMNKKSYYGVCLICGRRDNVVVDYGSPCPSCDNEYKRLINKVEQALKEGE